MLSDMIRARPDLMTRPQHDGEQRRWAIKDPVALTYYHLGEDEWNLFQLLDGSRSLSQIKNAYEAAHAPQRISLERLTAFIQDLHANGLVLSPTRGQGEVLLRRQRRERRRQWYWSIVHPLAIRLPPVDAAPLLNLLDPLRAALFHPVTFIGVLLAALLAITLLVGQSAQVVTRLPEIGQFLSGFNLVWLLVALAVSKIFHELGHALACRHFGGECREIGVQLLLFVPTLYCDVSDSWMIGNRWQRMAVAAAGIYVDFMQGTLAAILWYFSEPGILNSIFLNVVVICSVSTLLLNGNPLMQFDGYFILSDYWRVPNLMAQSREALLKGIRRWFIVSSQDTEATSEPAGWLVTYAIASLGYRLSVFGTILWFAYRFLLDRQLAVLGQALVLLVLIGAGAPLVRIGRRAYQLSGQGKLRRTRTGLAIAAFAAAAGFFMWIPVPHHVRAPFVVQIQGARYLYADVPGQLSESVPLNTRVQAGDIVARLHNDELNREYIRISGELEQLRQRREHVQIFAYDDTNLLAEMPVIDAALASATERQALIRQDLDRLIVRAPQAGTVLAPPRRESTTEQDDATLPFWVGTPLDKENRLCYLETGDRLCLLGDPQRCEVIVTVPQAEIVFLQPGQSADLRFDRFPGTTFRGTIDEIAQGKLLTAQPTMVARQELPVEPNDPQLRPLEASYQVRIQLSDAVDGLTHGSGGRAKIAVGHATIGARCLRYFRGIFRFQLH